MPKFDPMTGELITEETDGKGTASIADNRTNRKTVCAKV